MNSSASSCHRTVWGPLQAAVVKLNASLKPILLKNSAFGFTVYFEPASLALILGIMALVAS